MALDEEETKVLGFPLSTRREVGRGRRWIGRMTRVAFPMRPSLTFDVASVELVNALKGDGAALLSPEQFSDFLPRFAPSALLTNEINEEFEPTVKGSSTALLGSLLCLRVAHGTIEWFIRQGIAPRGSRVSE